MTIFSFKTHIHYQLSSEQLSEQALARGYAVRSDRGALVINTGKFTGRSPADKFIVKEAVSESMVDWNHLNQPISQTYFFKLLTDITNYIERLPEVWIRDVRACADRNYELPVRVITEDPQSNLFAANLFIDTEINKVGLPEGWHIIHAPGFLADPAVHGTRSSNFTVVSFANKTILIGGSAYTGEIKKAVFSILNFILPVERNVLGMHCSASEGAEGVALFFGLSGTGKTTLSADPERRLIGDDEIGWSDSGVFNLEGGCYAKVHGLTAEREPAIFNAIRPGAMVENTVFHPGTSTINFQDTSVTENTRVSYPIEFMTENAKPSVGDHPKNIFFLTCDAYGVLPPISRLSKQQVKDYFLMGYTARVAGTEHGQLEPKPVFSPCFGAPFLPLPKDHYTKMLIEKIELHRPAVWLVNTGWTGGSYGAGQRIDLADTRTMVRAALSGELDDVMYKKHPVFGLRMPVACRGIAKEILDPRLCWPDPPAYDIAAEALAVSFGRELDQRSVACG